MSDTEIIFGCLKLKADLNINFKAEVRFGQFLPCNGVSDNYLCCASGVKIYAQCDFSL